MADNLQLTVRGRVATPPSLITTSGGRSFTQFRLAHTPRIFDAMTGGWSDGKTEWFSVVADRDSLQKNIAFSLHKGVPIVVVGRLRTTQWTTPAGVERQSMELKADTIGIDLAFGVASFVRHVHVQDGGDEPAASGLPGAAPAIPGFPPPGEAATAGAAGGPASPAQGDLLPGARPREQAAGAPEGEGGAAAGRTQAERADAGPIPQDGDDHQAHATGPGELAEAGSGTA